MSKCTYFHKEERYSGPFIKSGIELGPNGWVQIGGGGGCYCHKTFFVRALTPENAPSLLRVKVIEAGRCHRVVAPLEEMRQTHSTSLRGE